MDVRYLVTWALLLLGTQCANARALPDPPTLVVHERIVDASLCGLVVRAHVGTPPRKVLLQLTFARADVHLFSGFTFRSATYDDIGHTDMLDLGTGKIRVPFHKHTARSVAEEAVCKKCDGWLGINRRSALWQAWPRATLSNSELKFHHASAVLDLALPYKCDELETALTDTVCVTATSNNQHVLALAFESCVHLVADEEFAKYVGSRSLHDVGASWPAFSLDSNLHVPASRMASRAASPESEGAPVALAMRPLSASVGSGSVDVILGASATSHASFALDTISSSVAIVPDAARSGMENWSLVVIPLVAFAWSVRWNAVDFEIDPRTKREIRMVARWFGIITVFSLDFLYVIVYEVLGGRTLVNKDAGVHIGALVSVAAYASIFTHLVIGVTALLFPMLLRAITDRNLFLAYSRVHAMWTLTADVVFSLTLVVALLQKYSLVAGSFPVAFIGGIAIVFFTRDLLFAAVIHYVSRVTQRQVPIQWLVWYAVCCVPLALGTATFHAYYGVYQLAVQQALMGYEVSLAVIVIGALVFIPAATYTVYVRAALVREVLFVHSKSIKKT